MYGCMVGADLPHLNISWFCDTDPVTKLVMFVSADVDDILHAD